MVWMKRNDCCGPPSTWSIRTWQRRLGSWAMHSLWPTALPRRRCSTQTCVMPFGDTHKNPAAYLGRLMERPSFARAVKEAQPYLALVPK